jgi:hypothetical protein
VNAPGFSLQRKLWFSIALSLLVGSSCGDDSGSSVDSGLEDEDSSVDARAGTDGGRAGATDDASEPHEAGSGGRGSDSGTGGRNQPEAGTDGGAIDAADGGDAGPEENSVEAGAADGGEAGDGGSGEAGSGGAGAGGAGAAGAGAGGAGAGAGAGGAGAGGSAGAGTGGSSGGAGAGAGGAGAGTGGGGAGGSVDPGPPSFLSTAPRDHSYNVVVSGSDLSAEWKGAGTGAVRSSRSIAPHQGVFYFEAQALGHFDLFQMGVSDDTADLSGGARGTMRVGVDPSGSLIENGSSQFLSSSRDTYGFVVDYRGDHPVVYVIGDQGGGTALLATRAKGDVSNPLFIHLSGVRRMQGKQVTINTGNDTVNWPFTYNPRAVIPSDVGTALVLGWGSSNNTALFDAAPTVTQATVSASTIALGESVTLTASSQDADEDAPVIRWEVPALSANPASGTGTTFTTRPNAPGTHLIRYRVTDALGKTDSKTTTITVTGSVPPASNVRLEVDEFSGAGITLNAAGLRAKWTIDEKNGVRANQGLAPHEGFWYFEGHRLTAQNRNQGVGLVIGGVSLNPYSFENTPPSCSVNTAGPNVWQDLMVVREMTPPSTYYGFAVDYREDTPTVYVIIEGHVESTLHLTDATVPIYPMLYGNRTGESVSFDMEINFGASSFHANPMAALSEANVSTSSFHQCWSASACP